MKKYLALMVSLLLLLTINTGCNNKNTTEDIYKDEPAKEQPKPQEEVKEITDVNVVIPAGTPAMSAVQLLKEEKNINKDYNVNYELTRATDTLSSKLISEEADIAIVPTNLAAKMYNKGKQYEVAGVGVWGNLYLISKNEVSTFEELKGKEIYMMGQGMTPDIILRYLFSNLGIDPDKDLEFKYLSGATELLPNYKKEDVEISVMPEPMLSVLRAQDSNVHIMIDFQEEWKNATQSDMSYPQAAIIVKRSFAENHKAFVNDFVQAYKDNIQWIENNMDTAGTYAEELKLVGKKAIFSKSYPGSNIKFIGVDESKNAIQSYLQVLFDYSEDTVGGKLPDEGFYYKK